MEVTVTTATVVEVDYATLLMYLMPLLIYYTLENAGIVTCVFGAITVINNLPWPIVSFPPSSPRIGVKDMILAGNNYHKIDFL